MRQKLTIGILLVFCLTEMRPLFTFVRYYIDYDYISEVLCINKDKPMTQCHGTCYLRLELQKAQSENDSKDARLVIEWSKLPMLATESSLSTVKNLVLLSKIMRFPFKDCNVQGILQAPDTPPPQAVS